MAQPFQFPSAVPMFPLPNVVLFPGQALPLHVFEDRYKLMLRHVLASEHRLLGMELYKKGWEKTKEFPPTYPTACVGRVGELEELSDGRFNLILHGLVRVEVQDYDQRTPFRIAQVKLLTSAASADTEFDALLEALAVSIRRVLPIVSRDLTWEQVQPILSQLPGPSAVADFVAAYLPVDVHIRQELLETLEVEMRLRRILEVLAGLLSVLN